MVQPFTSDEELTRRQFSLPQEIPEYPVHQTIPGQQLTSRTLPPPVQQPNQIVQQSPFKAFSYQQSPADIRGAQARASLDTSYLAAADTSYHRHSLPAAFPSAPGYAGNSTVQAHPPTPVQPITQQRTSMAPPSVPTYIPPYQSQLFTPEGMADMLMGRRKTREHQQLGFMPHNEAAHGPPAQVHYEPRAPQPSPLTSPAENRVQHFERPPAVQPPAQPPVPTTSSSSTMGGDMQVDSVPPAPAQTSANRPASSGSEKENNTPTLGASFSNVASSIKDRRRSSTKAYGASSSPAKKKPGKKTDRTSIGTAQEAIREILPATGVAKRKGHNQHTPRNQFSGHAKAVQSRTYRAGTASATPVPQETARQAKKSGLSHEVQQHVAETVRHSLGLHASPPAVTPAKRAVSARAEGTRSSKRLRASTEEMQDPAAESDEEQDDEEDDEVVAIASKQDREDIERYSREGEDLDWTKEKDLRKRNKMKQTIANRKSAVKRTGREWSKQGTPREQEKAARRRSSVASMQETDGEDADVIDVAQGVNDEDESDAEGDEQRPVYNKLKRKVTAQSLARIEKYSKPGENLYWPGIKDPIERRKVRGIINSRVNKEKGSKQQEDEVEEAEDDDGTPAADEEPSDEEMVDAAQEKDGSGIEEGDQRMLYAQASPQALKDIEEFSKPGEDLFWPGMKDTDKRNRTRSLISSRKHTAKQSKQKRQNADEEGEREDGDHEYDTPTPSPTPAHAATTITGRPASITPAPDASGQSVRKSKSSGIMHPTTGLMIPQSSIDDIKKYALPGEDLDWTKLASQGDREVIQKKIKKRKAHARAGKDWKSLAQHPEVSKMGDQASGIFHPVTGQEIAMSSINDIKKYSLYDGELDWTTLPDKNERLKMTYELKLRKSRDKEGKDWKMMAETEDTAIKDATTGKRVKQDIVATIAKWSAAGHDVDWTQDTDPKVRQRKQDFIRSLKKQEREAQNAAASDEETEMIDGAIKDVRTNRRVAQSILNTIAKYTSAGHDVDWTQDEDMEVRKRKQDLIDKLKKQDITAAVAAIASEDDEDEAESEEEGDGDDVIVHPVTGKNIKKRSWETIQKYSRGDLDWHLVTDKKERTRMQQLLGRRKADAKKKAKLEKMGLQSGHKRSSAAFGTPSVGSSRLSRTGGSKPSYRDTLSDYEDHAYDDGIVDQDMQDVDDVGGDEEASLDDSAVDVSVTDRMANVPALDFTDHRKVTDEAFMGNLKAVLAAQSTDRSKSFYGGQSRRILQLLNLATPPQAGEVILFPDKEEAAEYLKPGSYFDGPMIVHGQQPGKLQTIPEFFDECLDDDMRVHVQNPGMRAAKNEPRVQQVSMRTVKKRFASKTKPANPWNLLELAAHCEHAIRPDFLNNMDCRLLTKVKLPSAGDFASRRGYDPGWKEVESWGLVAQAGALTEPHQDSHGYSTFITVNQGIVGFGWLSQPTKEERAGWAASHSTFTGGRWRYVILRKGTTVYFPGGTVHFVFRHPAASDTLCFGGHVLRMSQIVRWVKTLRTEQESPNITNEDLTVSAAGYLDRVENLVEKALKSGEEKKMGMWGGREAIEEFLVLKAEFIERQDELTKEKERREKARAR